jgi:hypothetical protein
VVFFTTDRTFVDESARRSLEDQLTWIPRGSTDRGEIWMEDNTVVTNGDSQFHAAAVTSKQECFTASAKLSEALMRYYSDEQWHFLPSEQRYLVLDAIQAIRDNSGSRRSKPSSELALPRQRPAARARKPKQEKQRPRKKRPRRKAKK